MAVDGVVNGKDDPGEPAGIPLARRRRHLVGVGALRGRQPDRPGRSGPRSPVRRRRLHPAAHHRRGVRDRAAAPGRRRPPTGSRSATRSATTGWTGRRSSHVDSTDLLRIRCEWREGDGEGTAKRVIYAWAVHSSRRRQVAAERRAPASRAAAVAASALADSAGAGPPGAATAATPLRPTSPSLPRLAWTPTWSSPPSPPGPSRRGKTRPRVRAAAPVSSWYWPAVAAIVDPRARPADRRPGLTVPA